MHTNPEVLALLALGEDSATPAEREHVASCDACRREVAELAHLAGVGRAVQGAAPLESPRPEVWERIRAEIGFESVNGVAAPPASTQPTVADQGDRPHPVSERDRDVAPSNGQEAPGAESPRRGSRGRRILSLVLAAAIALILGVGIGLGWSQLSRPTPTVIGEAELDAKAPQWTGSSGEATLERDASGQRILVVRVTTPRPVSGIRTVWVMDSTFKKMQTVGQLTGPEGRFTIEPSTNLAQFPVVDVSEEPPNDVNPVHSGITIVRGTLNV